MLKEIVPEEAGVIIRTAVGGHQPGGARARRAPAAGAVGRRQDQARADRAEQAQRARLLYEEPDLLIKVVRDLFNEDFSRLVVEGDEAWETVCRTTSAHVAPGAGRPDAPARRRRNDVFAAYRIDEQLLKALDRKVWLPSGGTLVIDRTEAMTVIDVNTGKFTGSGGNLEETVTRNNLEAAEEVVRQLRLRDIGGIIVVDFIDMVLEANRDLVLRRLTECLARDRTRHQVAEVTSLGLVQMTRKRVGSGLLEHFSDPVRALPGPRRDRQRGADRRARARPAGERVDRAEREAGRRPRDRRSAGRRPAPRSRESGRRNGSTARRLTDGRGQPDRPGRVARPRRPARGPAGRETRGGASRPRSTPICAEPAVEAPLAAEPPIPDPARRACRPASAAGGVGGRGRGNRGRAVAVEPPRPAARR